MSGFSVYEASVWIVPVILAITLHEAAHAWVAWKLGDDTAYRRGRVSFNPIKHIHPVGTLLLPALLLFLRAPFLLGWARPVPVDTRRFDKPRRDMMLVALAGPGINLALALVSAWPLRWVHLLPDGSQEWVADTLLRSVVINVILAVFNMLPLPPLDGGRVVTGLLPRPLAARYVRLERVGLPLLILLLIVLPLIGQQVGVNLNLLAAVVLEPVRWMIATILGMAGVG